MLKTILSVSGKPGLFRLLSSAKNMVIVESLADQRRSPIHARDKVVSLGDIAMYTDEGEVALAEILATIYKQNDGKQVAPISKTEELRKFFADILPTYDRDRVYDSDIKKLITWYNLLITYGISFEEMKSEEAEVVEEAKEEKPVAKKEKEEKPAAKKTTAEKEEKATAKKAAAPKKEKEEKPAAKKSAAPKKKKEDTE